MRHCSTRALCTAPAAHKLVTYSQLNVHSSAAVNATSRQCKTANGKHPPGWLLVRDGTTMTHPPAMERYRAAHSKKLGPTPARTLMSQPKLVKACG